MRIAVSSNGQNLDAQLDSRFGRCNYFLIVDLADMSVEVVENASRTAGSGVGIEAAQRIVSKGVTAVITGYCGPNATQVLNAAGVNIITDQFGTVRDIVERYKQGTLNRETNVMSNSYYGMGVGNCKGLGMGRGRGRGMGRF